METRIIKSNELGYVRVMFQADPKIEKKTLTPEKIDSFIEHLRDGIEKGSTVVSVSFENGEPVVMYVGYEFQDIAAWYIGLTKTLKTAQHFRTSAKIMAPAFDELAKEMESRGYYKVWMSATERNHNIRNLVMRKYSTALPKYDWYDDVVVPRGGKSGSFYYDVFRFSIHDESSIVVRLFMLKQEYRRI